MSHRVFTARINISLMDKLIFSCRNLVKVVLVRIVIVVKVHLGKTPNLLEATALPAKVKSKKEAQMLPTRKGKLLMSW
jgi:hypothetical protein